jgi:hypothetical protein
MAKVHVDDEVSVLENELQALNLKQHLGALQAYGCDQLSDLADSTRDELMKEVGLPKVKKPAHESPRSLLLVPPSKSNLLLLSI